LSNFHPKITDQKKQNPSLAVSCFMLSVRPLISAHLSKGASKNMQFSRNYNQ
ncbi:hypothetical protein N325_04201, partial [Colius striatus]